MVIAATTPFYQGQARKLYAFCLVECHSRKPFVEFTPQPGLRDFRTLSYPRFPVDDREGRGTLVRQSRPCCRRALANRRGSIHAIRPSGMYGKDEKNAGLG